MQQNLHKDNFRECKECKVLINVVKKLLVGAFDEKHLRQLKNNYTGLMDVSIHQIFEHLHATCDNTSDLDVQRNE